MLDRLFKRDRSVPPNPEIAEEKEYTRYAIEVEQTLRQLEAHLHTSDDPEEIAMLSLKTACEFYQGDWAGILEVDMDLNLWTPFWWYNTNPDDKTVNLLNEFESSEFLYRWVTAMRENRPVIVRDAEIIKDEWPGEYNIYKRLSIQSIIGVPVKPRPVAFLVVRNPQRYVERSSMLQMLAFVVLSTVNEKKLMDSAKMVLSPEAIKHDKDIVINFFGSMSIYTSKGVLREQDLKAPKCCRVVTYLMLNRKATHPPLEIAAALWPDDTSDPDALSSNIRGLIYRFRQAFSLVSDYQLIESKPNGYRLNPELHITTDLQQFDKLWEAAQNATATSRKVELLKQAIDLYTGPVYENACDEHWIINLVNHYSLRYAGIVNELLTKLEDAGDYSGIQHYAIKALEHDPGNIKARYWLIVAMHHLGAIEMAKSELERAREILTTEEYESLRQFLKAGSNAQLSKLIDE